MHGDRFSDEQLATLEWVVRVRVAQLRFRKQSVYSQLIITVIVTAVRYCIVHQKPF